MSEVSASTVFILKFKDGCRDDLEVNLSKFTRPIGGFVVVDVVSDSSLIPNPSCMVAKGNESVSRKIPSKEWLTLTVWKTDKYTAKIIDSSEWAWGQYPRQHPTYELVNTQEELEQIFNKLL
jgi:hypothetical protein